MAIKTETLVVDKGVTAFMLKRGKRRYFVHFWTTSKGRGMWRWRSREWLAAEKIVTMPVEVRPLAERIIKEKSEWLKR